jgi:hypothetical protein
VSNLHKKEVKAKKRNEVKDYGKQNKRDRLMYNAVCKDNEGKRANKRKIKEGIVRGTQKVRKGDRKGRLDRIEQKFSERKTDQCRAR